MSSTAEQKTGSAGRNYSAFDAELTHQALNLKMFMRLLKWTKPYRITLGASVLLVVISASFTSVMPILTNIVVIDRILAPQATMLEAKDYGLVDLTEWISGFFSIHMLFAALILYVVMIFVQSFISLAQRLMLASGSLKTLRDLRVDLFAALERKPSSFYDNVAVGRVMTRVTNDVENLYSLISSFISHLGDFVPFIIVIAIMFHMSIELTLVSMVIIPIAAVATYLFRIAMREIFRLIRDSVSALNQYMQEDLMGIEVVQLSGREEANIAEYTELNRNNRYQEFRAINYEVVFDIFNTSLTSIAVAAIIWYGGGEVAQQAITLGTLILFTHYINMMVAPVSAVGRLFNTLFRSMASGERIFQALDWEETIHEPENPTELPEELQGDVEFRNVEFGYLPNETVLHNVSFHIQPGEKLAIVGPTGSGKSTIIRLLARFYDFDNDMIFVDGHDVNDVSSHDLRKRIGVVLQDFHIFSGTILDNITLNNPDITRERAEWAARVVNADRFIQALPDGYETELAERGHNLSQGQQQLLAFARVLAANCQILVLDEATSSIDTGTELVIQDALHKLTEGRTSIIIAHRLQTIQECDRILVLHRGRVRELGTHEELMALKGIYYTLHELQFQDVDTSAIFDDPESERDKARRKWIEIDTSDMDPSSGRDPIGGTGTSGLGGGLGGALPPNV